MVSRMTPITTVRQLSVRLVGGSTALLGYAGLRLVTDPTFDPPAAGPEGRPRRLTPPALSATDVGPLDAALVSHDQHPDNLDSSGRTLLEALPLVLTTTLGAARLGGTARGVAAYETVEVPAPHGVVHVTGVPAQHGPEGAEEQSGPVTGFVLQASGAPTVYVSGDNASVDVVREIADRLGAVDVALLFAGAARVGHLFDGEPLTLDARQTVDAARVLGARAVVPLHCDGWTHYTQSSADVRTAFAAAGLAHRLHVLTPGQEVVL